MDVPEILVVDTTILYSSLVYNGVEHKIIISGRFLLLTTDFNMAELVKVIKRNLNWSDKKVEDLIKSIPIIIFTPKTYGNSLQKADSLIGKRDLSDVPLVALALSTENDGIFTSDRDFEDVEKLFKIWNGCLQMKLNLF